MTIQKHGSLPDQIIGRKHVGTDQEPATIPARDFADAQSSIYIARGGYD
jgi:hypothetical protein